jgi:phosphoribosylamine--glycine ligase
MSEKVLVYGTGARDHCLADEYIESAHVGKVYFAPGNPGIEYTRKGRRKLIERIPIRDFSEIARFCKDNKVSLVDVGSENPLDEGLVDVLNAAGIPTVGPRREYARLENDRAFTDDLLTSIGVPKPAFRVFDAPEEAKKYVRRVGYQVVVKANGLAAGKGAIVCDDVDDAEAAIDAIMVKKKFGKSGDRVVVEARKYGTEISFFAYLDGKNVLPLNMFAQDYKPAFDPDQKVDMFYFNYGYGTDGIRRGLEELRIKPPENLDFANKNEREDYLARVLSDAELQTFNTGGTGCYCPHKLVSPWLANRIIEEIVNPTVRAIYEDLGWKYKGVLYFGLNLDPYGKLDVFEINVRHGDPEAQVILRKLQTDLFEIGMATWNGKLDQIKPEWNKNYYVDVIAMMGRSRADKGGWYQGYPGRYGEGYRITGLENLEDKTLDRGVAVFFSGVDLHPERGLVTKGGRVLHVVASDSSVETAAQKAYRNIQKFAFLDHNNENQNCMRFRTTIGSL